jgi:spore coat protein A
MISRRDFLKIGAVSGLGLMLAKLGLPQSVVKAFFQSNSLSKFVQPLRGVYPLDPNGIPVAVPDGKRLWKGDDIKAQHYTIDVNQYEDKLHPDLGSTTLRGYHSRTNLGGAVPQRHLGGIIVAQKGTPVQITFQNNLTGPHPLMVDTTVMGAELGENRISTHLHGGEVPWISDGGPFAWSDSTGGYGTSAQSGAMNIYKAINKNLLPGQSEVYYPNNQSARMMWYHDHAVGITRLNAYAGIASAYIIRDKFEAGLRSLGLPDFIENGGREIPLIFQDKIFVGTDTADLDPSWAGLSTPGSLWYPHNYDLWDSAPLGATPFTPPASSVVPEMFGDTMLVNGVVHPFAGLEPRRYRLRILNACQARFLNLQLYDNGSGMPDFTKPGPSFLVIGTEGGFLSKPVNVPSNQPMNYLPAPDNTTVDLANPGGSLLTAPGERWDVIIDFAGFGNKKFILYNDAPAPFPGGDPTFDHDDLQTLTTRTIMRLDIGASISGAADAPMLITPATPLALNTASGIDPFLVPLGASIVNGVLKLPKRVTVRQLTLNEVFDEHGRLAQLLGTNVPAPLPMDYYIDPMNPDNGTNYARAYDDVATETPKAGTTEVWQIANLTMDTHPIHFHLVNAQILARQSFTDANGNMLYANGVPTYTGLARGPEATELGWKETIKMNPGEVTTVIMKFRLPKVPFTVPASPRTGGNEYVWHCHILDHEEHDMMRPLIVK